MLYGILVLIGVILGWAICFYAPYAYYLLSYTNIAGMSQGDFIEGTLLGLVITIGNQVVYLTCAIIADSCMFQNSDLRMTFNVTLYTGAVFINTVIDMWIVFFMAHGFQQDSGMDPEAAVRNPSMQHALFVQLIGYLWPCTLLVPFLFEPIILNVAPYFLGTWLIRSRRVHRRDAEDCMACPEFDLLRYGDNTINVEIVLLCFFLSSMTLWWIFLMLFCSLVYIYAWDHFRFLRGCQRTYFCNAKMEIIAQYFFSFPCAMLAAAFFFKLYSSHEAFEEMDPYEVEYHAHWYMPLMAFTVHLILHCLVLRFLVPCFVPEDEYCKKEYKEVAEHIACNWFNSNPVHVLRSHHFHCHDPPHIYYQPGKEYLLRRNEAINSYYEQPEYEKESALGADLHDVTDHLKKDAAHMFQSVKRLPASGISSVKSLFGKKSSDAEKTDAEAAKGSSDMKNDPEGAAAEKK